MYEKVKKVTYQAYKLEWATSGFLGNSSYNKEVYLGTRDSWESVKKQYPNEKIEQFVEWEEVEPVIPRKIEYNKPLYKYVIYENQHYKIKDVKSCVEYGTSIKDVIQERVKKYKGKQYEIDTEPLEIFDSLQCAFKYNFFSMNECKKISAIAYKGNYEIIKHYEFRPIRFIEKEIQKVLSNCEKKQMLTVDNLDEWNKFKEEVGSLFDKCEYDYSKVDLSDFSPYSLSDAISDYEKYKEIVERYVDINKFKKELHKYLINIKNKNNLFKDINNDLENSIN